MAFNRIVTLSLEHHDFICLFLDYAKAFYSVPHEHLLLKIESIGISGNLLEWIQSFQEVSESSCEWFLLRLGTSLFWSAIRICFGSAVDFNFMSMS